MPDKSVLFLTVMDFTESGIQVTLKTPAYFAAKGWDVHYLVGRDASPTGSYHYQKPLQPEGFTTERFSVPTIGLLEALPGRLLRGLYFKLHSVFTVLLLAYRGRRALQRKKFDVIYGFGTHGVLAAQLLRLLGLTRGEPLVSRFFGTWTLASNILERRYLGLLATCDTALALYLKADLCVITDDGSRGDAVLAALRSKSLGNFKFWVNGVDRPAGEPAKAEPGRAFKLVTIARLVTPKRVDRAIEVVARLVHEQGVSEVEYHLVGDGSERPGLERLARERGVETRVVFHGALPHEQALRLLRQSDAVLSTFQGSNVANQLLEAIRAHKVVFTLEGGDTAKWISYGVNGFIYSPDEDFAGRMAADIARLRSDEDLMRRIVENVRRTEKERLWTWDERLAAELAAVESLLPRGAGA